MSIKKTNPSKKSTPLKMPTKTLKKCCESCPFLLANANKQNPEGFVPDKSKGEWDWYTQENLNRLWLDGLSDGQPMVCHTHDPKSSDYGGKGHKTEPAMCLGSVMKQFEHIDHYQKIMNANPSWDGRKVYRKYTEKFGKLSVSFQGMQELAWMFTTGRTGLFGGLAVPRSSDETREMRNITI